MKIKHRLSLDAGTNSLGWSVLELNEAGRVCRLVAWGVRIFSDSRNPKDGASLASLRRQARQMRRQRDRKLRRRKTLVNTLKSHGLMPIDDQAYQALLDKADPYALRARGVEHPLSLHEFGRALIHLEKRRGFKSSRKAGSDAKEEGIVHASIAATRKAMQSAANADAPRSTPTMGEFLHSRKQSNETVRARRAADEKAYTIYFERSMAEQEFEVLFASQARFHPEVLTPELKDRLRHVLFYQRPLKPVMPGRCWLEPEEFRARRALPTTQRFRIYQELANLRILDERMQETWLTVEQRDDLAAELERKARVTFKAMRKRLRLPADTVFNLESEKRPYLVGNETSARLGHKNAMGDAWFALDELTQDAVVELLCTAEDDLELAATLHTRFGIAPELAAELCKVTLEDGFGRVSLKAMRAILPALKSDVRTYDKACKLAGYEHSNRYDGVIHDQLPYYGEILETHVAGGSGDRGDEIEVRYGRIPNPTVHVALNQIRKVVNAIIETYGQPAEIVVELARELKLSEKQKKEREKEQSANQKKNDAYRVTLTELGQKDNYENRLRLRLWEELNPRDSLDRRCPFTGAQISVESLFSPQVEIEHLMPFARSLDDSPANKVLCMRWANRYKHNHTPYEAFGTSPGEYVWEDIAARAASLPPNKRWRFAPDAHERLEGEERDFLARQLHDTAYLSRVAREYLTAVCLKGKDAVWVTPGRLTSLLRHHWGLNSLLSTDEKKNRRDHRHHALDAAVIGCTDRATLNQVARSAGRDQTDRAIGRVPEPWPGFRMALEHRLGRIVVSHKPEHSTAGALHEETAYGLVEPPQDSGPTAVVRRVAIEAMKPGQVKNIRDPHERAALEAHLAQHWDKKPADALKLYTEKTGVRALRIVEMASVAPIKDADGKAYKAYKYGGNYCLEVYAGEDGMWRADLIRTFDANSSAYQCFMSDTKRFRRQTFSGRPLVMRLCKNDYVAIGQGVERRILRVVQVSDGLVMWAEHWTSATNSAPEGLVHYPSIRPLQKMGARRVFVDALGRVKDPHTHAALDP